MSSFRESLRVKNELAERYYRDLALHGEGVVLGAMVDALELLEDSEQICDSQRERVHKIRYELTHLLKYS